jgi:mRNA interferase RelE/StbE
MKRAIAFSHEAAAQFLALDSRVQDAIERNLDLLAMEPETFRNQIKMLKGSTLLRLRVGDYRIIYSDSGIVLSILRVVHRSNAYR